jgi:hypothetical protein
VLHKIHQFFGSISIPSQKRLTSYRKSSLRKTFSTITMSREKREKTFLLMTSESHFKYRNEYTQVTVNVHVRGCQGVKERKSLCHLMSCELFLPLSLKQMLFYLSRIFRLTLGVFNDCMLAYF